VVALQIHSVSEATRSTLSAAAKARGESLQEYLLDVLDREARDIENRRLLAQWTVESVEDAAGRVDQTMIIAH
jgi:hypothetical protein